MRIYIDETLALDKWHDQAASIYTLQQTISQGIHRITVEYYNKTGRSTAHVTWRNGSPQGQPPAILAFTASPSAVTPGQVSSLSWIVNGASTVAVNQGVGDVTGVNSKTVQPGQTTTYRLTASNGAGSVTADATVTVVAMSDTQAPSIPSLTAAVAKSSTEVGLRWSAGIDNVGVAGYQVLRNGAPLKAVSGVTLAYDDTSAAPNTAYTYAVKAFDAAGNYSAASNGIAVTTPASSSAGATCGVPGVGAFTACYFSGVNLSGSAVQSGTTAQINFDWGSGSPGPSVPPANFSARWQGYFDFDFAVYSFVANASDGVRVYVDNRLVIDNWKDQPVTATQASTWITKGSHLITMEYYARTGSAAAHLTWQK